MPRFSDSSFSKLSVCHPDLQAVCYEVVKYFDCTIIQTFRNETDQNKDFEDGKTQLKWPNSKHNTQPCIAVDMAPDPIDWNDIKAFYFFAGYVLAIAQKLKDEGKITHSLRWGGCWDGNKNDTAHNHFADLDHFELIP